ncbi:hypothetical protein ACH50O_06730 [Methylomonas sp. 2BW1-5-20]|uniref:hypothetical protein n=1 Tax=Methylomonas sp. 2BW1-5-20 TaxID=3376686 RepID=UPI0040526E27
MLISDMACKNAHKNEKASQGIPWLLRRLLPLVIFPIATILSPPLKVPAFASAKPPLLTKPFLIASP